MPTKTKKELAQEYKIGMITFIRWLKKIPGFEQTSRKRIFTPAEVEKIYNHLGTP